MLPHQDRGELDRQPPHNVPVGVDEVPIGFDFSWFR
jgi:hypothetical protein